MTELSLIHIAYLLGVTVDDIADLVDAIAPLDRSCSVETVLSDLAATPLATDRAGDLVTLVTDIAAVPEPHLAALEVVDSWPREEFEMLVNSRQFVEEPMREAWLRLDGDGPEIAVSVFKRVRTLRRRPRTLGN